MKRLVYWLVFAIGFNSGWSQVGSEEGGDSVSVDEFMALAADDSVESIDAILSILNSEEKLSELRESSGSVTLYRGSIHRAVLSIASRGTSESYEFLVSLFKGGVADVAADFVYFDAIDGLVEYNELYSPSAVELLDLELRSGVLGGFDREKFSETLNESGAKFDLLSGHFVGGSGEDDFDGEMLDSSRAFSIVRGLLDISSDSSQLSILRFLETNDGLASLISKDLAMRGVKEVRYGDFGLRYYGESILDERLSDASRRFFVKQFFDNSTDLWFGSVDDGTEVLPQISDADERALVGILEIANHALGLPFVDGELRLLVEGKREEAFERLVSMGYDNEDVRDEGWVLSWIEDHNVGFSDVDFAKDGGMNVSVAVDAYPPFPGGSDVVEFGEMDGEKSPPSILTGGSWALKVVVVLLGSLCICGGAWVVWRKRR